MPTTTPAKPDVPAGASTKTGYATALAAFVAMILAYIFPDGDAQTLGVIASGVVALVTLVTTNLGRQRQAVEQIRQVATVEAYKIEARDDEFEPILPADTEGLDPEYDGRTGELDARLALEQREACQ